MMIPRREEVAVLRNAANFTRALDLIKIWIKTKLKQ